MGTEFKWEAVIGTKSCTVKTTHECTSKVGPGPQIKEESPNFVEMYYLWFAAGSGIFSELGEAIPKEVQGNCGHNPNMVLAILQLLEV